MASRSLSLVVASAVLLGSGLVHGFWTQRWQTSQALVDACSRLNDVPSGAGPWKSTVVEVDPEPFEQARALSYWVRLYTDDQSGKSMTVILMCGRADHMSVHTPDVCYRGAGLVMVGDQVKTTLASASGAAAAEFWTARFRQPSKAASQDLRIYWTWGSASGWRAPASPRWTFGGEAFLYKLYVTYEIVGSPDRDNTAVEFLQHLMPTLDSSLCSDHAQQP